MQTVLTRSAAFLLQAFVRPVLEHAQCAVGIPSYFRRFTGKLLIYIETGNKTILSANEQAW